jgi:hypothetical protein
VRRILLIAAVLIVAGVVAACAEPAIMSPDPPVSSAAPTVLPSSVSPTHQPIGRLPVDCEPGPDPVLVSDHVGHGIGGDRAWAIGFGAKGTLGMSHEDPYQGHGWLRKVLWLVQRATTVPITVTGERVDDGSRLWFAYPDPARQATSLVLDPAAPDGQHGDWYEYRGYFVTPAAGCYRLSAAWPGGGWDVDFRAGLDPSQSGVASRSLATGVTSPLASESSVRVVQ